MRGTIALIGGDEFRDGCETLDRAILDSSGAARPELLVIPTAAASENPSKAAGNGVSYFSGLGAQASPLMVLERAHANDKGLLAPVDSADVLYFTGGNPAHLLSTLKGSLLLEKAKQALRRGAVVAGSSAGAMVMGSWMRFGVWMGALGVAPGIAALPHHEHSDPDAACAELATSAPQDTAILGIDGKTGCLGRDRVWTVAGKGRVALYRSGRWRRFTEGEVIDLADPAPKSGP